MADNRTQSRGFQEPSEIAPQHSFRRVSLRKRAGLQIIPCIHDNNYISSYQH